MNDKTYKKPPFLSSKAVKYWNFLLKHLESAEGFHEVDCYQLGILCNALQDYQESTKTLEDEGKYYTTGAGLKRLHPAHQVQTDALKTVRELGAAFGLNFKGRGSLLKMFAPKKELDAIDRL
jgi:P27 family predicted phage terminase small subunit